MKKSLLLIISFFMLGGYTLNAQVDEEKKIHMYVVNNRSTTVDLKVKLNDVDINPNTDHNFCWDICYTPGTVKSSGSVPIAPGDSTGLFYAYYTPNGETDTSTVEYCFNIATNASDSICRRFKFSQYSDKEGAVSSLAFTPVAFVDDIEQKNNINMYPNPTSGMVNLSYDLSENGQLVVLDMVGKVVFRQNLNYAQNSINLNLSDLNEGVYFYNLMVSGNVVKTEKLILTK